MILQERSEQLYIKLSRELKRFSPGKRFHTIRHIERKFGVSYRVADVTLDRLEKEGLLERRDRSGLYVRSTAPCRSVAFFYIDWPGGHQRFIAEQFGRALLALGHYDFSALPYNYQSDLIPQLEACPADLLVVFWPPRPLSSQELVWLGQFSRPLVLCDLNLRDISHHCFFVNSGYVCTLALTRFRNNGHRRIGILLAEPPFGENWAIHHDFLTFAPLYDCVPVPIECRPESGNFSPELAYLAMMKHLDRFGLNFTGLFVISGHAAQGVQRALNEHGISVPGDLSVIAFGNPEFTAYFTPPLTTIADDENAMAVQKADAVHRYLQNPASGPIIVESRAIVYEHQSVCNLHSTITTNPNSERNMA